jgi:hypothetical protein
MFLVSRFWVQPEISHDLRSLLTIAECETSVEQPWLQPETKTMLLVISSHHVAFNTAAANAATFILHRLNLRRAMLLDPKHRTLLPAVYVYPIQGQ